MSPTSRIFVAILLLSLVTIEFGGRFLLSILQGKQPQFARDSLTYSLFRAGHAHAGVLVILAIVVMPYIDLIAASDAIKMALRALFGSAPILVSVGMFGAGGKLTPDGKPGSAVLVTYVGALALCAGLVVLGIELLRL
jgi:hypothetical protein